MIGIIDVYYLEDWANAALIGFDNWEQETILLEKIQKDAISDAYVPGQFYKKELPAILKLLEGVPLSLFEIIVVDGYVFLDDNKQPGMGHYLWQALDMQIPIIGVAKNKFKLIDQLAIPIFRGESKKPLYVTSVGIDQNVAANFIQEMKGNYRIPELLKAVDQLSRKI